MKTVPLDGERARVFPFHPRKIATPHPSKPDQIDDLVFVETVDRIAQLLERGVVAIILENNPLFIVAGVRARVQEFWRDLSVEFARLENDETDLLRADLKFNRLRIGFRCLVTDRHGLASSHSCPA